jgi:uncharacterized membrane protein YbhN (UPF0104 family)
VGPASAARLAPAGARPAPSLATIAWTRAAAVLIAVLPISISGLGVREGAMVVLLAPYGIAAADALAYALLAFATTILAVGLLGSLLEAWRMVRGPGPG